MVHKWFFPHHLLIGVIIATLLPPGDAGPWQCQSLRPLVEPCNCQGKIGDESLVVIACNNMNLMEVPKFHEKGTSPHTIYELTLALNKIQTIPAERFQGLKIQRLDLSRNPLNNISSNAFLGLENILQELKVSAAIGSSIPIPRDSLTNLTTLSVLHMEYFQFPNNGVTMNSSLHELRNLKSLTLAHNNITYMFSNSLPDTLTTLTLDHQRLYSIPVDVLSSLRNLQSVAITNTLINSIGQSAFDKNNQLKNLDLGYNKISGLHEQSFKGITTSLQSLTMRNNPLGSVDKLNPLKHLTALTSLQLSNIGLTSLPPEPEFLKNKTSLVSLHLDHNDLISLVPNVFKGVRNNLQELSLSYNQLRTVTDESLSGLPMLTSLDISHQTIPSSQTLVIPASLESSVSLRTLKMSGTPLDQGALWTAVSFLTALKTLYVDSTLLTSITDHSLMNLTQLEEINLDNNNLLTLTQAMLAGPRNLTKLWVNNNNITTISRCILHDFTLSPALDLQLAGNPLHCNCQLNWLLTLIDEKRVKTTGQEKCATPFNQKDKLLSQFNPGDFICIPAQPDPPPCSELFTTAKPPTTTPHPYINLVVTYVTKTSVHLKWTIADIPLVSYFKVSHLELAQGSILKMSDSIDKSTRSFEVSRLKGSTRYSFCLQIHRQGAETIIECVGNTTLGGTPVPEQKDQSSEDSSETGLIVGVVVGLVALLAILGAILYIIFMRKHSTKKDLPSQPHTFTTSELPGIGPDTRHFARPREEESRRKQPPKVGRALDSDFMKVAVISDGRTGSTSPRDRQSMGSYQFLDEKHPNPNPEMAPSDAGYKDMGRPLPDAPVDSMEGYYNNGFNKDNNSHHVYNQIEL